MMKLRNRYFKLLLVTLFGLQLTLPAQAELAKRNFCVWDPVGASGPIFNLMKSTKPAALKWGVELDVQAYTDEKIASEEFKAGQCDAVLLTGTRARKYNKFTGSLEALGAIPSTEEMRMVLETLSQPKAAKLLTNGNYEIAGFLPAGAVYLFMRDKELDTVRELQGQKIATFDYDMAALQMVRHVGASVVGSSSSNFAGKFNNGSVDIVYAPAIAYSPLELSKGIAEKGGVFDVVLAQLTFQIIILKDRFPEGFGQNVRNYAASRFDKAYELVGSAEAEIKQEEWIHSNIKDKAEYAEMFRSVRISLRDSGVYDGKALKLFRKVRCKKSPTNAECIEKTE